MILSTRYQVDASILCAGDGELIIPPNPTLKNVRMRVLWALKNGECKNPWLARLIANCYTPMPLEPESVAKYGERDLLEAQKIAVEKGAGCKDISLVLGPPWHWQDNGNL